MSDDFPRHGDPEWTKLPPGSRPPEPPDPASAAFIAECADDPDLLAHALVDAYLNPAPVWLRNAKSQGEVQLFDGR